MRESGRSLLARLLPGALLASCLIAGVPAYLDRVRLANDLRSRSLAARKEILFGDWYRHAAMLDRTLGVDSKVDFVLASRSAGDIAVLGGSILQPRDVRFFDGWNAWRQRRRAEFFHDSRAANAPPGPPPGPADIVIRVDPGATPPFRQISRPQP